MESQHHQGTSVILRDFPADPKHDSVFGRFAEKYRLRIYRTCLRLGLQDADADADLLLRGKDPADPQDVLRMA